MRRWLRLAILILLGLFLRPSAGVCQDVEAGKRAANRGDFAEALINWAPLAEWGDPEAQYNMGLLLARGDGVTQDFLKAHNYFKKAAEQGHRKAAGKLSTMYKFGDGVSKDAAQSAYWKRVADGLEPIVAAPAAPTSIPEAAPTVEMWASTPAPTALSTFTPAPDLANAIPTQIQQNADWDSPSSKFNIDEWILPDESGFSSSSSSAKSFSSSSSARRLNLVPDDEDY